MATSNAPPSRCASTATLGSRRSPCVQRGRRRVLHWLWANKYWSHPRWARKRAAAVMPAEAVHRRDSRTVGPRRSCHHTAPSVLRLEPEASEEVCVRPGRGSPPTEHNPLRCPAEAFLPSARGQPVAPQSGLGRPAHGRGHRTLRSARWQSCRTYRDDCQAIGPTGGLVRGQGAGQSCRTTVMTSGRAISSRRWCSVTARGQPPAPHSRQEI